MENQSRLSVRLEGSGIPVVIVHGWMQAGFGEAFDFEPIFNQIEGYQRHYIDLPGMGSSPADGVTHLDAMFDRLDEYINEAVSPASFLLIGSSCGACLARALALKHSSRVLGLLLRVPLTEPVSSKRNIEQLTPLVSNATLLEQMPSDIRKNLGYIPFQTAEYTTALQSKLSATDWPAGAVADTKILEAIRNDPNKYFLFKPTHTRTNPFHAPALLVHGRYDLVVGHRDGSSGDILDSYPRATTITLDGATHSLPVTESEKLLFKALVLDWLSRVNEYRQQH